ncbi:unnamed protein product [Moneuplotes crassus]|uniref:Uncharacterized protein n=1 Tax=Euplotes crassus TaxID=5936 RepID=A0AAD1YAZ2_EUPCR|nr:unnamed protein product [Moneuplotes crassus]
MEESFSAHSYPQSSQNKDSNGQSESVKIKKFTSHISHPSVNLPSFENSNNSEAKKSNKTHQQQKENNEITIPNKDPAYKYIQDLESARRDILSNMHSKESSSNQENIQIIYYPNPREETKRSPSDYLSSINFKSSSDLNNSRINEETLRNNGKKLVPSGGKLSENSRIKHLSESSIRLVGSEIEEKKHINQHEVSKESVIFEDESQENSESEANFQISEDQHLNCISK